MPYYHGSNAPGLKEMTTAHSRDGNVYVTNSRVVALTYAVKVGPNLFTTENGKEVFLEVLPNLFKIMVKGRSGYVYTLENKNFKPVEQSKKCGHQNCFSINQNVKVVGCEYIESLYDELLKCEREGTFKVKAYGEMPKEQRELLISE